MIRINDVLISKAVEIINSREEDYGETEVSIFLQRVEKEARKFNKNYPTFCIIRRINSGKKSGRFRGKDALYIVVFNDDGTINCRQIYKTFSFMDTLDIESIKVDGNEVSIIVNIIADLSKGKETIKVTLK